MLKNTLKLYILNTYYKLKYTTMYYNILIFNSCPKQNNTNGTILLCYSVLQERFLIARFIALHCNAISKHLL